MIMEQDTEIQTRVLELLGRKIAAGRRIDLDSSVMDFVMELEDEFDITIPLDQIAEVRTVGDLANAVEALSRKRVAALGGPMKEDH